MYGNVCVVILFTFYIQITNSVLIMILVRRNNQIAYKYHTNTRTIYTYTERMST